jgi:NAD(P)-dependent dehydrogenase (short-subunit alcohol dehydrogenase family)
MDLGLRDKAAIVTGGSHGIGRAIALGLADEGCHAVICARGEERLRKAAREIEAKGVRALPVAADITKAEDMERLVQATVEAFGRIDILVNNASAYVAEDSDAAWQSTVVLQEM